MARTGIDRMSSAASKAAKVRAELLTASPFLISNLMPIFAFPLAALVNGISKEKALGELLAEGVFKETLVNPGQELGNSPYMHLRLTSGAYEATVLRISDEPKNVLQNFACSPKVIDAI